MQNGQKFQQKVSRLKLFIEQNGTLLQLPPSPCHQSSIHLLVHPSQSKVTSGEGILKLYSGAGGSSPRNADEFPLGHANARKPNNEIILAIFLRKGAVGRRNFSRSFLVLGLNEMLKVVHRRISWPKQFLFYDN